MKESGKDKENELAIYTRPSENFFGDIAKEIENAMKTWSTSPWMPSLFDYNGLRLPLCEIADRGNRYELNVEIPGMGKEDVKVKAQSHCVEISARKTSKEEERTKGRIYTERSESSFYRQIPLPEEIIPQKIKSRVRNGILFVELPKRSTRVRQGK